MFTCKEEISFRLFWEALIYDFLQKNYLNYVMMYLLVNSAVKANLKMDIENGLCVHYVYTCIGEGFQNLFATNLPGSSGAYSNEMKLKIK